MRKILSVVMGVTMLTGFAGVATALAETVAPTVSGITPTTGQSGVGQTYTATYSDNVGVTSCNMYIDGVNQGAMNLSAPSSTSGTATSTHTLVSGTYTFQARCMDPDGNTGFGTNTLVTINPFPPGADTTAPIVSAITPTSAASGTAQTYSATYSDNVGVTNCTLYIDGVSNGLMTLSGVTSTSGTASKSVTSAGGTYTFHARCMDASGNTGVGQNTTVTVNPQPGSDIIAPTVGGITPTTAQSGVAQTYSATYSDNIGVTSCSLYVNNSNNGLMTLTGVNAMSGTSSKSITLSGGVYLFQARCLDAASNTGFGATTTVTVVPIPGPDTTAPSVSGVTPTSAITNVSQVYQASYSDGVGVTTCNLFIDGSDVGAMTLSGVSSTSGTASRSASLSAGTHSLQVRCSDAAGNVGSGAATSVFAGPSSCPFATGLLVKLPDDGNLATQNDSAVYYYASNCQRHAFPNEKVYFSWYTNFSGVSIVSSATLASMPLGANVTYRPGVKMVKFTTVNKVYAVAHGGALRWVTSEALAAFYYGPFWNTKIDDISDAFYTNYTFGADINTTGDYSPSSEMSNAPTIDSNM